MQAVTFGEELCTELVAAVGEASYQPALKSICGSTEWERVRFDCMAALVSEPENQYDSNAVQVFAESRAGYTLVGYLSRGDALDYRDAMLGARDRGLVVACKAHIAGREAGSETPNLGIFLDLPTPEAALTEINEMD